MKIKIILGTIITIVLVISITYIATPANFIYGLGGLSKILPSSLIWSNDTTAVWIGEASPMNKKYACSKAQYEWGKKGYSVYSYRLSSLSEAESFFETYPNMKAEPGYYESTAYIYNKDGSIDVVYAREKKKKEVSLSGQLRNEEINIRLDLGFNEINLDQFCEMVKNSEKVEPEFN